MASEGAFDWQVPLFEDVFGARVVRWYGQTEKVAFGSACPDFAGAYHLHPTYGIGEVVDNGTLLGTGFTNWAMPLLRYDTEDRADGVRPACACGMPFRTISGIKGRWDQTILWGIDEEPISTAALNFHDPVFMEFERFQFRQVVPGQATLLLVRPEPGRPERDAIEKARRVLQARVGDRLEIDVEEVSAADLLSERGKVVAVDQRHFPGRATDEGPCR
ncbi:MAG: hypothetical protein M3457_10995 [Chloroflexota bacterium]|nr:hypothetical protein [Chloroflexota bacterium]